VFCLSSHHRRFAMTDTPFMRNFVETAGKFESIFQPNTAERRKQLVDSNNRLVHYTSAASGIEIIKTKRLWMRSTTCMSDFREVQHGFDILNRFFSNEPNMRLFESALDECVTGKGGIGMDAIALFNQQWPVIRSQTYVACISEHRNQEDVHGRLSMWRAFGRGARVALVFRLPLSLMVSLPLNVPLSPVAYFTEEEVETEMKRTIEKIRSEQQFLRKQDRSAILGMTIHTLMLAVISLKHEGFAEELEWRVSVFKCFGRV
jgi:hypothetical protein